MTDIEEALEKLKNGIVGVGAVKLAEMVFNLPVSPVIEGIGGLAGMALGAIDKEPTSHNSSSRKQPEPQHYEPLIKEFNAANNSTFGTPQGVMSGGASQTQTSNNGYNWDNIPEPKIWIRPDGDGREFWDSDYSEHDNFSERTPNDIHGTFYEPIKSENDNCESCVTERPQTVTKRNKPVPQEVQTAIDRWQGKSETHQCGKYETDMPINSCFKCNGGQQCDHLAHFDGTHRSHHCIYPKTRNGGIVQHDAQKNGNIEDYNEQSQTERIPTEPELSENNTIFVSPTGKPLKPHRKTNRTHLTGIERKNLLNLVDKTLVDDKESLKQELADHIDETLTFAENKTIIEEYLSSVIPMSDRITQKEVMETEANMAHDWQNGVSARRWEDADLIDGLKTRADMGDSSASAELELIDIEKASFVSPAMPIEPIITPSLPMENAIPQQFNEMNSEYINPFTKMNGAPESITPIEPAPFIPPPIMETPDLAMSWNSSTPETIRMSETFVPPAAPVDYSPQTFTDAFNAPHQVTANPQQKPLI